VNTFANFLSDSSPLTLQMSSSDLEQLRAAAIDGRTNNVRFRQKELHALSAALQKSVGDVLSAISEDAGGSSQVPSPDVQAEYYLAMDGLKRLYGSLNFQQSLKDEYLIAHGADNTARRVSKGIVVIRPTRHARFYSVVCTLATAITAGNCVVLEVGISATHRNNRGSIC
jgi:acyl-CoA reductase-like NAD-dependent aldehyde dehydrogenase